MRNTIVIAILLAGAVLVGLWAQPRPAAADDEKQPQTVLVVYDLRDYLEQIRDYPLYPKPEMPTTEPAGPQAGVANTIFGGGDPQPDDGSQQQLVDEVVKLVESTVQPDTWRDAGGSTGSITELGGKLYVTETPDAQAQVKALLESVTGDAKRTVRISATWLLLTDDQLAALRQPAKLGVANADIRLDDAALAKATPFARADLLCLNDQTAHITAGAGNIRLQVHPILVADKHEVILDALNLVGGADAIGPTTRSSGDADSDHPSQRFHTTARIPLDADVVMGGITFVPATDKEPAKDLYLVVRVDAE